MASVTTSYPKRVELTVPLSPAFEEILTPEAVAFVARLARKFGPTRARLLQRRTERQAEFDAGLKPDFLPETRHIREAEWTVAPIPADLRDRRVEITGPADRKMIINALNSGTSVFMADFEDANAPTLHNMLQGQANLRDAIRRTINFTSPEGKQYRLNDKVATLLTRPRGWRLTEKHMLVEEVKKVKSIVGSEQWAAGKYPLAADLFDKLTTSDTFIEFLTLPGYDCLEEGCQSDWPWAQV
jgi:malate synthase